jgi:hypothetical protein
MAGRHDAKFKPKIIAQEFYRQAIVGRDTADLSGRVHHDLWPVLFEPAPGLIRVSEIKMAAIGCQYGALLISQPAHDRRSNHSIVTGNENSLPRKLIIESHQKLRTRKSRSSKKLNLKYHEYPEGIRAFQLFLRSGKLQRQSRFALQLLVAAESSINRRRFAQAAGTGLVAGLAKEKRRAKGPPFHEMLVKCWSAFDAHNWLDFYDRLDRSAVAPQVHPWAAPIRSAIPASANVRPTTEQVVRPLPVIATVTNVTRDAPVFRDR